VVKAKNNKEKHIQFYSTNIFTVMEEPVMFFFYTKYFWRKFTLNWL